MYKIAFTTVTFRNLSRSTIAKVAVDCDIMNIEWGGDVHLPMGDKKAIDEVLELNEKFGLRALSYGSYYRVGSCDYDAFQNIADTANAIGAKVIRVWLGSASSEKTTKGLYDKMVVEVQNIADIAKAKGLQIAFEFHNGTYNDNADNTIKFLSAVDRDNVGTYWQPLGNKEIDEQNLIKVLPYLLGIHVFNWNRFGMRHSLRTGITKWRKFIEIAKKSKAEIPFIIEFVKKDKVKQFKKDVNTLNKLLKDCYGI